MRSCLYHAFEILNNVFPKKLGRSKFSRLECRGSAGCLFLAVVAGNFQTRWQLSTSGGGGGGEGSSWHRRSVRVYTDKAADDKSSATGTSLQSRSQDSQQPSGCSPSTGEPLLWTKVTFVTILWLAGMAFWRLYLPLGCPGFHPHRWTVFYVYRNTQEENILYFICLLRRRLWHY